MDLLSRARPVLKMDSRGGADALRIARRPEQPYAQWTHLSPAAIRERLGDGCFGGRYQRGDDEMFAIWRVAVEETRALIEAGLPGYDVSLLFAVVMPAGTPGPIVARLNREINAFMATPEVKRVLLICGGSPIATLGGHLPLDRPIEISDWP